MKKQNLTSKIILAVISALMVLPLPWIENHNPQLIFDVTLIDVLLGTSFGMLVMVPYLKKFNVLKVILMVLSSISIYVFMVHLAISEYAVFNLDLNLNLKMDDGIVLSGGIGALLVGLAIKFIAPVQLKIISYPLLFLVGLIAGYVFSIAIDSQAIIINSLGYMIWQVSVCVIIHMTLYKSQ